LESKKIANRASSVQVFKMISKSKSLLRTCLVTVLLTTVSVVSAQEATDDKSSKLSGNATIRAKLGDSEIVITTTSRLAGAIHSLTWNRKEFIDSFDHGRQLQSAASFDCQQTGEYWAERYNPTEAGSRADGTGPTSTSRLLSLESGSAELKTRTQMAFWLAPNEDSVGRPALNKKTLSDVIVSKHVRIGYENLANVISYQVAFDVPSSEHHNHAVFEALTGYMPAEFERFLAFDPKSQSYSDLSDGPGEQSLPVVLATSDGKYAMGVYSPDQHSKGFEHVGYGRFRFPSDRVTKWNCVFRVSNPQGIEAKTYRYQILVAVGSLEDVRRSLVSLSSADQNK
jgi:hypothetical protein